MLSNVVVCVIFRLLVMLFVVVIDAAFVTFAVVVVVVCVIFCLFVMLFVVVIVVSQIWSDLVCTC